VHKCFIELLASEVACAALVRLEVWRRYCCCDSVIHYLWTFWFKGSVQTNNLI